MKTLSLTNTMVDANERTSPKLVSTLHSILLVFLLFFPVTFMTMFLHEAGHALFHLSQGVPVHFLYAHPFSFVGFIRPMADYYSVWLHASGTVFELLVSGVIFVLLWKNRSFYTLPFLMVFPWVALYDGIGGIFDILGNTGDYYNILTITGWSPLYIYAISLILSVVGVFFFVSLFPLLGLSPENRKSLLVLPIGMLLFTSLGIPVAYYLVPGSPIDLQYHLAHEIILSAYYRPLFMGAIGIFLSLVYIILYRKLYRRIPLSFLTELTSLSRRDFWYPGLLFVISIVLGFMVIL